MSPFPPDTALLPYRIVDAFTSSAYSGNPASILLFPSEYPRAPDEAYMQSVAAEFNLSETAFLSSLPAVDSLPTYRLRWFTPQVEFPLCGHGTLASAHILFGEHHPEEKKIRFDTMSGTLFASRVDDGRIELDFPADVSVIEEVDPFEEDDVRDKLGQVSAALLAAVVRIARGKLAWIVELKEEFELEKAVLDVGALKTLEGYFVFTQPAGPQRPGYDIYSRVFDPVETSPEDPVTGSAHCMLAPYWLSLGHPRLANSSSLVSSKTLKARQGGRRQGELEIVWDVENWRCKLRGNAVTVMEGRLRA
ncbi:hypothetical protein JCM8547_004288 [Rhodosporidiobolus lusitaniae]